MWLKEKKPNTSKRAAQMLPGWFLQCSCGSELWMKFPKTSSSAFCSASRWSYTQQPSPNMPPQVKKVFLVHAKTRLPSSRNARSSDFMGFYFILFYGMLKLLCLLVYSETYGLKIPNPTDSKLEASCVHISFY